MIKSIGGGLTLAVLLGAIEFLTEDYDPALAWGLIAFIVALASVLFVRFTRLATVADHTGLVVRGFVTTHRVSWSRVQEIIVEVNASHYTEQRHPREIAVAYLDTGRRLPLRGVDDKNLAAMNLQLPAAVAALRERWIAGRGEHWQPIAAVQAKAADMAQHGVSPAVLGMLVFIATVAVTTILAVVLLLLRVEFDLPVFVDADSGLFLPLLFGLLLGVPVLAGTVVGIRSAATRRRARAARLS